MIAARDIKPLELVLSEEPAVVGPYSKSASGCLQCLKKSNGDYACTGCQFPMCNAVCEKRDLHRDECSFFQEKDPKLNSKFALHNTVWVVESIVKRARIPKKKFSKIYLQKKIQKNSKKN
jgi:coenzyme F420-reducing hydrogenase gamma subunit